MRVGRHEGCSYWPGPCFTIMPEVPDVLEAERIVRAELASWFNMPTHDLGSWYPPTLLDIDDLNIHLDGEHWIVGGFAVIRVLMGGGMSRTWYGRRRRVEYWSKILRSEPFLYRLEKSTGRIVEVDHNMSTARSR